MGACNALNIPYMECVQRKSNLTGSSEPGSRICKVHVSFL